MLINRVRRTAGRRPTPSEVVDLAGLGSPAFFIDPSGINSGDSTWTDSAGGRVGTFDNANFDVLSEGGRDFVRLTNCRCAFPTGLFTSADTAITVLASIRPPASALEDMELICQPRTTSSYTYSWALGFFYSTKQLRDRAYTTYYSLNTRTYTKGVPTFGSWGVAATSWYNLPDSAYTEETLGQNVIGTGVYPETSVTTYPGLLALHSTANLPLLVGGGRLSTGAITSAYNGDIEWLGIWKVPATRLMLESFYRKYNNEPLRRVGYGVPPKKAPARTIHLLPQPYTEGVYSLAEDIGVEEYDSSNKSKYKTGDVVLCQSKYIAKVLGPSHFGAGYPGTRTLTPAGRGSIFVAENTTGAHLMRLVEPTEATPQRVAEGATAYVRNGDTIAIALPRLLISTSAPAIKIDVNTRGVPSSTVSGFLTKPRINIRTYRYTEETDGVIQPGLELSNGVFNLEGFSVLRSYANVTGYILATRSTVYIRELRGEFQLRGVASTIYVHRTESRNIIGDRPPSYVNSNGSDTVATVRTRQLGAYKATKRSFLYLMGSYAEVGFTTYSSVIFFSTLFHSKARVQQSHIDYSMSYTDSEVGKYMPVMDSEAPGGGYLELIGASLEGNAKPGQGAILQDSLNMSKVLPIVSVKAIGADIQSVGPLAAFRCIGVTDSSTYKSDMYMYADRPSISFGDLTLNSTGSAYIPDSPLRSRSYVELLADNRYPGERTFEIDFTLLHEDSSFFANPRGLMSLAVFYYGADGKMRVYRDAVVRTGVQFHMSSTYTLVQKNVTTTWSGVQPTFLAGSRVLTLPDVGIGPVKVQVFLGTGNRPVHIHPVLRIV